MRADSGAGSHCDAFNDLVFGFVKSSGTGDCPASCDVDGKNDLDKLMETVRQLRAAGVRRIVILVRCRYEAHAAAYAGELLPAAHVIADRIAAGVSGPESDERMATFSRAAGLEYISAWHVLCNADGCLTRVGPTASDVVATDIIHLSDAGSNFLVGAIEGDLFGRP